VLLLPLGVEAVGSGDLDPSFSGAGRVLTDFGPGSWDRAAAVAIQADGKLVVAGASNGDFALVRYLPDGTLDATCGSQGKVFTDCCSGNDTLVGGTGDDTLLGESDIDVCDGGAHGRGDTATGCEHVTGVP
jgi:sugar lactone lactonase YvrE